jgi:hypothetical protein
VAYRSSQKEQQAKFIKSARWLKSAEKANKVYHQAKCEGACNQSPSKPLRLTKRDTDAFTKASMTSRKMLRRLQEQPNAAQTYS